MELPFISNSVTLFSVVSRPYMVVSTKVAIVRLLNEAAALTELSIFRCTAKTIAKSN
jgi:hypothetical protein